MFDIGWSELLVIAVVAIIVVGPKDLPRMMRTFGSYAGKLRRMAAEFQRQFDDAMRESELDEVRKAIHSVRDAPPLDLGAPIDKPLMVSNQPKPVPVSEPEPEKPAPKRQAKPKPKAKAKPKPRAKPAAARRAKQSKSKASRGKKP
jgi:sec-independent protein translocase protein TatB